jgi:fused signal recognition particle receptor
VTFIILFIVGAAVVFALTVGLALLVGRRPTTAVAPPPAPPRPAPEAPPKAPPEAPPAPPAAPPEAKPAPIEAPPAPAAPAPPAEVVEAPPVAPPAPPAVEPEAKPSVATRFLRSLTRSRTVLGERLGAIMSRGKLDEEAWEDVEEALIRADVGVAATDAILQSLRRQKLKPEELGEALRTELVGILDRTDRTFRFSDKAPSVWLVAGVNGTGKTTSIAKLARMLQGEGKTVVLAAADTFRAAAIDQLGTWAERLGVHMIRHAPGADPGAVVFDAVEYALARSIDVVIVDTAGRLHTKSSLMDELKKIRRIAERKGEVTEALLVLDATVGQNGIAQARTFGEAVQVTGVVLTKLDGSARGGIVVAVQEELGIPVKAVGIGEQMGDLELFDPKAFVDALVEVPGDAA